jgi:hypothetical protein
MVHSIPLTCTPYQQRSTCVLLCTGTLVLANPCNMECTEWLVHPECRERRPDVAAVYKVLSEAGLSWNQELVRQKLCPLLLEWDARHPKQVSPRATLHCNDMHVAEHELEESAAGHWC